MSVIPDLGTLEQAIASVHSWAERQGWERTRLDRSTCQRTGAYVEAGSGCGEVLVRVEPAGQRFTWSPGRSSEDFYVDVMKALAAAAQEDPHA